MKKYPKVRQVGHKEIAGLFDGPVVIQEKIDGSNFGFGWVDGRLSAVSRRLDLSFSSPERLFKPALDYVQSIAYRIPEGYFFRCEFLANPKHNVLAYSRTPLNGLVLFDIEKRESISGIWISLDDREVLEASARQLGIEAVSELWRGLTPADVAREFFDSCWSKRTSQLGGSTLEGVVVKNYNRFTPDGSILLGKWVREEFKEIHLHSNPKGGDPIDAIGREYGGPARWQKALQRLQECGECTNSPEDIGKLIAFARRDIEDECEGEIAWKVYEHFKRNILGAATKGLAEWYKEKL